jgi:DNA ligase (NAD+)
MNINAAEATIDLLYKEGLVKTPADLYRLRYEDIISLERFAEKSSQNLISSITSSKEVPFPKVLFALGIRYVGETVARKLAHHFKSLEGIRAATMEELLEVDEIGERIAGSLISFFEDEANQKMIEDLKTAGLQFEIDSDQGNVSNSLEGLSFVISGKFENFSRDQLKDMVSTNGGKNVSSVSSKTSYILAGEDMGPEKLKKAEKLGIAVIDIDSFMQLLKD